jgi:AcrR family transcriptional regulator
MEACRSGGSTVVEDEMVDISILSGGQLSTQLGFPPDGPRSGPLQVMSAQARKNTQRDRLLNGMIESTNRRGYAGANVSAVIGEAGVSRPTFYDYFSDREDCLRAAIEHVQGQLLSAVRYALAGRAAEAAMARASEAIVSFAAAEPAGARFLMAESMAGGPGALDRRDAGIEQIAAEITGAQRSASGSQQLVDLDPRVVVGGVYRMLATRLRRGEVAFAGLADSLEGWLSAYERPAEDRRWERMKAGPVPARSPHVPKLPIQQMPSVFPPGRPRVPEEEIAENHRLRILYATARMAEQKGYNATTVADITRLASVDGSVFYRHFTDKQEAFAAVHELGFQRVMDITGTAFFSVEGWAQRSFEAARALTGLLQENPLIARVGFVEAYAVGQAAVQRIEDSHTAFMYFLQEGLLHASHTPSREAMEAIIAAIFEIIYSQARRERPQIAAMVGHITHLWLTPFLGVQEADTFIDAQLRGTRRKNAQRA